MDLWEDKLLLLLINKLFKLLLFGIPIRTYFTLKTVNQ
jgi:hypothetical protein